MQTVALILAKGSSGRLPNKNKLDFHGQPMFLVNVKKCLNIFEKVYVSSDDYEILKAADEVGAIPIVRGEELCGDTPNIPVYQHALRHMEPCEAIVAVQANSPTIDPKLIEEVKRLIDWGYEEVMTTHENGKIYGSIWALTTEKLKNYGDPYHPEPSSLIFDPSVDIHTQEDYELALKS